MRFVIMESFDTTEVNRFFEADISFRIGETFNSTSGKIYRVKDIAVDGDETDQVHDMRVLVRRER